MYLYNVTAVTEEAEPRKRGETKRGHQRERSPLLCLRVHEGEPVSADEGQVRKQTAGQTLTNKQKKAAKRQSL